MLARLRSWWKKTSKPLDAVIVTVLIVLLALLVVIILGYSFNWSWTGFQKRTLYDWLQLLIIPAVLAVGGYLFNYTTGRTERDIASDRQQEEALQAYIDSMSALLLEKNLRKSGKDDEVRKIARVRTLTVLPRLDGKRKASVLQFLYESGLIEKGKRIVDLDGADLNGVILYCGNLKKADLSRAYLRGAVLAVTDLSDTDLYLADLSKAILVGAILYGANLDTVELSGASLYRAEYATEQLDKVMSLKGAIMPDGTKHA